MKCKTCKISFQGRTGQICCSYPCAIEYSRNKQIKENRKELKEKIEKSETISQIWTKIQPTFNKIARLIDYKQPCISCGRYGKPQGGHFYPSTNTQLRFNLHNIHIQCYRCNVELSSNILGYKQGLIDVYGEEYADYVLNLPSIEVHKYTKVELLDAYSRAKEVVKELSQELSELSPEDRLMLRHLYNRTIWTV